MTEHFQALFPNRNAFVFHELIADPVHININILQPTEKDDYEVKFYMVIPACREGIKCKPKYGMEKPGKRFAEDGLSRMPDPHRPNLCAGFTEVFDLRKERLPWNTGNLTTPISSASTGGRRSWSR